MAKTVALIEGFAGGPLHTKKFRKTLASAGFKVIKDSERADIVIAHSVGIYGVPVNSRAKLLLLIGPIYWPGERLIKRATKHIRNSKRYHVSKFGWGYFLRKRLLEIYYFFTRHIYMWIGIKNDNRLNHLYKLVNQPGRKTVILRNHDDPFSSPDLKEKINQTGAKFIELPGVHDDYISNPKPYIDLLLKEL